MKMKSTLILSSLALLTACGPSIKMSIPETFQKQAFKEHVEGARGNKMSFSGYSTTKIKRSMHLSYPVWGGRTFFWDNVLLNRWGIQKDERVSKEKAKFQYTLTDGRYHVEVYADEQELTKNLEFEAPGVLGIYNSFKQLQNYNYIFTAVISADTTQDLKNWKMVLTNIYDRKATNDKNPFAYRKQGDNGLASNGTDTIYINPVNVKKAESSDGKTRDLPFKLLSGYELSTADGVIAIVDLVEQNIWFYNELDAETKLTVSAIGTALFARRVHDEKW